jgi:hypothetical protein
LTRRAGVTKLNQRGTHTINTKRPGTYRWMGWFGWFSRTNRNDGKRLREWRTAWAAAADAPARAETEALRARLVELGLEDDEHEIEREMLEGLESLVGLTERMGAGSPPPIETGHRAVGPDACYFSAPASLPDDPAQPTGTLLLTSTRAIFVGGAKALTIPWHGVGLCTRQERDVLLVRTDRQDLHRLRCNTYGDALHAAFLVRRLATKRRV